MNIPKTFSNALHSAYTNKSQLDKLFVEQKPFIMRLVRHALRYKSWKLISTEDDLFQEACVWILHFMWEWDESRGPSLEMFVTYNVGVRLQNQVNKELAQKRNPEKPPIKIINDNIFSGVIESTPLGYARESEIDSEVSTPEDMLILKRAYQRIDRELPLLVKEFLECLLLEDGNFLGATRRLRARGRIRINREMSDDAFRQWINKMKIVPALRTIFEQEHIINSDAKQNCCKTV